MKTYKTILGLLIVTLCSISLSQENIIVPKPFLNEDETAKLPDVIKHSLSWPTDQNIASSKVSISSEREEQIKKLISKSLNSSLYDPNKDKLNLITIKNWPVKAYFNLLTDVAQYKKGEYIINISHSDGGICFGIKRVDGNDIWDMSKDHTEFLPF